MENWSFLSIPWTRVAMVVALAVGAHISVFAVRKLGAWFTSIGFRRRHPKLRSVTSLFISALIFTIYFGAIGLILTEMGVSLTAYLASASVLGLAVGFGSQGLVQDVVTGLTLVFSDLVDVGDMVEIGGQTGIVQSIGMRFILLENALGAEVFIPNRSVTNVINYPKGYVRCIVDVLLVGDDADKDALIELVTSHVSAVAEQFPGVLIYPPTVEGRERTSIGNEYLRIKFRIWPGRGAPIEAAFKQSLVQTIKEQQPDYSDWMVAVNYEVERVERGSSGARKKSPVKSR